MYTLSRSRGSVTTVCVCDPRQVCTVVRYFGCAMSLMSITRMPRARSKLTVSFTPCMPQSLRPLVASEDTKRRFRNTDTSLCEPGHTYAALSDGLDGFEMSHSCQPL